MLLLLALAGIRGRPSSMIRSNVVIGATIVRKFSYKELSFERTGNPLHVLEYHSKCPADSFMDIDGFELPQHPSINSRNKVVVAMKYAAWNPADANVIQGRYPSLSSSSSSSIPEDPSRTSESHKVAGSGGIGVVVESSDNALSPGQWVTVANPGMGTFRTTMITSRSRTSTEDDCAWLPIPHADALMERWGPAAVSTLFQLGGTAWKMIHDNLPTIPNTYMRVRKPWIVQNAGNSGVGMMVSQLANVAGYRTLSLVRRGSRSPDAFEALRENVKRNGRANLVVAEEDVLGGGGYFRDIRERMVTYDGNKRADENPVVPLALNAVGGESSQLLLRWLEPGGTHLTYGGMAQQPTCVGAAPLIFRKQQMVGYWHSRWMVQSTRAEQQSLVNQLVECVLEHDLQPPPCRVVSLSGYRTGLLEQQSLNASAIVREKLVFDLGK